MVLPQVHDPRRNHPENFLLAHDISERGAKEFFFDKPTEAVDFLTTQGEALLKS
jgi:hypothetical protein